MINKGLIAIIAICVLSGGFFSGCGAEKEATERRNLMMPKKSEMMRNENRYRETSKPKTYKQKHKKRKVKKLF